MKQILVDYEIKITHSEAIEKIRQYADNEQRLTDLTNLKKKFEEKKIKIPTLEKESIEKVTKKI